MTILRMRIQCLEMIAKIKIEEKEIVDNDICLRDEGAVKKVVRNNKN
jgi:hypothetical protein